LIGLAGRLVRFRGSSGGESAGIWLRLEESWMSDRNRRYVVWRHNHAHP